MNRLSQTPGAVLLVLAVVIVPVSAADRSTPPLRITELRAASGKAYVAEDNGFVPGGSQYIDRNYTLNYVPRFLNDATKIKTAGDDKFIPEDKVCLTFRVNVPVTVYVVYGDKLRILPNWLRAWTDTRYKLTRKDSDPMNLKGLFTLFAKDFPAGTITLQGNLSKGMSEDEEFKRMKGGTFCMYSVVVAPKR